MSACSHSTAVGAAARRVSDAAGGAALLHALADAPRDPRGILVIAHTCAGLEDFDEILVLDHGRVVEHGDRDALAAAPASRFHHLLATSRAAQQVVR